VSEQILYPSPLSQATTRTRIIIDKFSLGSLYIFALPPRIAAYGLDTFTEHLEIRNILPFQEVEEDGGAITSSQGGGLMASREAINQVAPRTAAFLKKFRKLNEALVEVIEDYNMVSFVAASCRDESSIQRLLKACDSATFFIPTRGRVPPPPEDDP
jgi:hypothetical protein